MFGMIGIALLVFFLGSIVFPSSTTPRSHIREAQARETGAELRSAIENYYAEYKRLPLVEGKDLVVDTHSSRLMRELIPTESQILTPNHSRRSILFFSDRKARGAHSAGIWRKDDGSLRLNDPWGRPYYVMLDGNYDNVIKVPDRAQTDEFEELFGSVGVWSFGPNGVLGAGNGRRNDDIFAY